jgi:cell wall-associated NlpC family hydrolase
LTASGRATRKVVLFATLLAVVFLWGCARAPRRPKVALPLPPPRLRLTPQEVALQQAMRKFYGAPYRYGGTTPAGVDCSGLVLAVYQRVGLSLPRTATDQFTAGQPIPRNRLRFGDVVFFNRYCLGKKADPYMAGVLPSVYFSEICHSGIYLGNGQFLHASPRGVEISRLDAEVWRKSFVGARRFFREEGSGSR